MFSVPEFFGSFLGPEPTGSPHCRGRGGLKLQKHVAVALEAGKKPIELL